VDAQAYYDNTFTNPFSSSGSVGDVTPTTYCNDALQSLTLPRFISILGLHGAGSEAIFA
jgi:hypothetical protein